MNWSLFKRRKDAALHRGTARFTLPSVVLEVEPEFVLAALLTGSHRRSRQLRHLEVRRLESPVLIPHPSRPNLVNADELRRVIREVVGVLGNDSGGFGLLVPDRATRVAVLSFESLPEDHREAESLVRWRMKATLPFSADDTRMSFQVSVRETNHVEVLAVAPATLCWPIMRRRSNRSTRSGARSPRHAGSAAAPS